MIASSSEKSPSPTISELFVEMLSIFEEEETWLCGISGITLLSSMNGHKMDYLTQLLKRKSEIFQAKTKSNMLLSYLPIPTHQSIGC
jgi:hypothetical protein